MSRWVKAAPCPSSNSHPSSGKVKSKRETAVRGNQTTARRRPPCLSIFA